MSVSPILTITLQNNAGALLDSCDTSDGMCWVGEPGAEFVVAFDVVGLPAQREWTSRCYVDGVNILYCVHPRGYGLRTTFACFRPPGASDARTLRFGLSTAVKGDGSGDGRDNGGASIGRIRCDVMEARVRMKVKAEAPKASPAAAPSHAADASAAAVTVCRAAPVAGGAAGKKFYQEPGLCTTAGRPVPCPPVQWDIEWEGAVVGSSEVRYDLAERLILRRVITPGHGLWPKYGRDWPAPLSSPSPRSARSSSPPPPSSPARRRSARLSASQPPPLEETDAIEAESTAARVRRLKSELPSGFAIVRSDSERARQVMDLTDDA